MSFPSYFSMVLVFLSHTILFNGYLLYFSEKLSLWASRNIENGWQTKEQTQMNI